MPDNVEFQQYQQLEHRVGQVESAVDTLHKDNIRQQSAIASIATHIDNIVETIHAIDRKLDRTSEKFDAHQSRRPEIGGIAAVATVFLIIVGFGAALINDKVGALGETVRSNTEQVTHVATGYVTRAELERFEDHMLRYEDVRECR